MAEHYTVIAPDNRGMGDSSIPPNADYSSVGMASDIKGLLTFLNITNAFVFSYDRVSVRLWHWLHRIHL